MSGPGEGKILLGKANVYLNEKGKKSLGGYTYRYIELDKLNDIIKDKEATYCAGKEGGVFYWFKKEMLSGVEKIIKSFDKRQFQISKKKNLFKSYIKN